MSAHEFAEVWVKSLPKFLRDGKIIDNALLREIAKATPLVLVTTLKPGLVDIVFAFRAARRSLLGDGGGLVLELYRSHRKKLMAGIRSLPPEVQDAVKTEIRAHERFMRDIKALEAIPSSPGAGAVKALLSDADASMVRAWRDSILMDESPMTEPLKAALRQFLHVVGPQREASWKAMVDMARKAAGRTGGALAEPSLPSFLADMRLSGHVGRLQGEMFEHFARYSSQLTDLCDGFMRTAAARAGILGEGWEPLRSFGELRLAVVDRASVIEAVKRGPVSPASFKGWKQYADDSILAVKRSRGQGLGEAEITSLLQFKAEAGETGLLWQRIKDYRRVMNEEQGKTVLVAVGNEVFPLRPISGEDVTTFVSVGTSNTLIPDDPTLSAMGVDVMKKNLPISRDEIRELAEELLWEALKAI